MFDTALCQRDSKGRFVKGHRKLLNAYSYKKGHKVRLGLKHRKKAKEKLSKVMLKRWQDNEERRKIIIGQKNHIFTSQHRENISKNRKGIASFSGKEHPNWKGGKSFEPYSIDWTETLRRAIRERDNYICQLCNQYGNNVHHIDYDKKNCNPKNLITLCRKCNVKVNYNRNYWISYLKSKNYV